MAAQPEQISAASHRVLGFKASPLNYRRWQNFKANRRGVIALWVFLVLFIGSLMAEFIANDNPILMGYEGTLYFPIFVAYSETEFGGEFETEADYRDPFVQDLINDKGGWMVWPPVRYSYRTINYDLPSPAPSAPTRENLLGTDDQGRDVLARLIYGFRLSVAFGLILTVLSSAIGITAGALQGYFGGWTDLLFQRFIEVWSSLPLLYTLIIVSSMVEPSFWILLGIMLLMNWYSLVGVVRAEFLRGRSLDYVRAARALGVSDAKIMFRHVLPNAAISAMTLIPFILAGSITILTALDFIGLGLPPGSASLGELLAQGKANLQAPWLGLSGFAVIAITLVLVVFIGESLRDAFDPRKSG